MKETVNKNIKKRGLITVFVLLALCIALLAGVKYLSGLNLDVNFYRDIMTEAVTLAQRIDFEEPDFDADIFSDPEYLELNRYIEYSTPDGVSTVITDGAHNKFGVCVEMFAEYFDALMHGDIDGAASLYSEECLSAVGLPDEITMQKIYDIRITLRSETVIEDGEGIGDTVYTYKVAYKISGHDGTFRSDMGSDVALPLIYEVTLHNGEPLITGIQNARFSDLG